ncbi:MAG: tetratricopeptide (TPR) repeat protein [Verrucomicrobiales bacterium]|jgi:tetratricopeptide (TPR) repeat protein
MTDPTPNERGTPLPSEKHPEGFAKPLPEKRKQLLTPWDEGRRPPGEVPDRLKFDEMDVKGPFAKRRAEVTEETRAWLEEQREVWSAQAAKALEGKEFTAGNQTFQDALNEAINQKKSRNPELHWGQEVNEVNPGIDKHYLPSQEPSLLETLWGLRLRIGLILAVFAVIGGLIASLQFSTVSDQVAAVRPLAAGNLVGPDQVVEEFLDPWSTAEQRHALLRSPVDLDEVRKFFSSFTFIPGTGAEQVWENMPADSLGQGQMLDVGYHLYRVTTDRGEERLIYVTEELEGFRIDWDAFARPGDSAWEELENGNQATADLRVFLRPSSYYNFGFSDQKAYSAFLIISPKRGVADLFAYARRGSLTERILTETVSSALKAKRRIEPAMKLRLESVEGSHRHRQFLASSVLASEWVESRMGTLYDLWAVSGHAHNKASFELMQETAAQFDAPLMYRHAMFLQEADPETAADYLRTALDYRPDFLEARTAHGAAFVNQNKLDMAEAELKMVLEEEPTFAPALYQLALCATLRGDADEAVAQFESLLLDSPDHVLSLNNLAWILSTHEDPAVRYQPRVVQLAERAAELSREANPSVLATLGVAYAAVGQFSKAITKTQKALRLLDTLESDQEPKLKLIERIVLFKNGEHIVGNE